MVRVAFISRMIGLDIYIYKVMQDFFSSTVPQRVALQMAAVLSLAETAFQQRDAAPRGSMAKGPRPI